MDNRPSKRAFKKHRHSTTSFFDGILPDIGSPLFESTSLASLRHLVTALFRNKLWGEKSTVLDLQALTELCRRAEDRPRVYYITMNAALRQQIDAVYGARHLSEIFHVLPHVTRDRIRCFLMIIGRFHIPTCRSFRILLVGYLVPAMTTERMAAACHTVMRYCLPLRGLYTEDRPFIWDNQLVADLLEPLTMN